MYVKGRAPILILNIQLNCLLSRISRQSTKYLINYIYISSKGASMSLFFQSRLISITAAVFFWLYFLLAANLLVGSLQPFPCLLPQQLIIIIINNENPLVINASIDCLLSLGQTETCILEPAGIPVTNASRVQGSPRGVYVMCRQLAKWLFAGFSHN